MTASRAGPLRSGAERVPSRLELRIDSLAAGGEGVGRAPDGRVTFVPLTAPGDRVRVRVTEARRRHLRGEIEALLEAGPERVEPPCPVFGECGGCAWQHVAYPAQVEAKARILRDALERIGRLAPPGPVEVRPSPRAYGYRARARVGAAHGRVGFRRRGSHRLLPVERCPVLVPALDAELARLAAEPPAARGECTLAGGDDGSVALQEPDGARRGAREVPIETGAGPVRVAPETFFQASAPLRAELARAAAEAAGTGARALELFAGAGFLTLPLASRFERVVAVESSRAAARALERNLGEAVASGRVRVEARPAERVLAEPSLGGGRLDAVVVDPPRTGLARGSAPALAALAPRRIVYVSCDPATLARDARALAAEGYRLADVRGFDLFPQTPHVEAVALLERREDEGGAEGAAGRVGLRSASPRGAPGRPSAGRPSRTPLGFASLRARPPFGRPGLR